MNIKKERKQLLNEIEQNKPRELTAEEIRICFKIISFIGIRTVHIKEIADHLKVTDIEARHYILMIRREMNKFQNPTGMYFIVADQNGYKLTEDEDALETYLNALLKRYKNILSQILQIKLSILNGKEEHGIKRKLNSRKIH